MPVTPTLNGLDGLAISLYFGLLLPLARLPVIQGARGLWWVVNNVIVQFSVIILLCILGAYIYFTG